MSPQHGCSVVLRPDTSPWLLGFTPTRHLTRVLCLCSIQVVFGDTVSHPSEFGEDDLKHALGSYLLDHLFSVSTPNGPVPCTGKHLIHTIIL